MKSLIVFGTRPEAIKLAPVVRMLDSQSGVKPITCCTGQHREMVRQVVDFFGMEVSHDLDIMTGDQTLADVTINALRGLDAVVATERPDWVVVQGDTTSTFAGALAAYYHHIPVAHVEAGLRTGKKCLPFPEEMNRTLTGRLADLHFAPTERAVANLTREGVERRRIHLVGNTVTDALHLVTKKLRQGGLEGALRDRFPQVGNELKVVLVTAHRRESFGPQFRSMCEALRRIATEPQVEIIFPVHLNPNVREPVYEILSGLPNVALLEPVDYPTLVWLAQASHIILTDSGGIQEEAASLGKPVVVMRNTTERMESVEAGVSVLAGTQKQAIVDAASRLLGDDEAYRAMARPVTIYGDGTASQKIANLLMSFDASSGRIDATRS